MPNTFVFAPMSMAVVEIRSLSIPDVKEIIPVRHGDERGFFSEIWNEREWAAAGLTSQFVQDNHSRSEARGVLRGLHYQLPPAAQDKLIRVTAGAIFDVALDIRRSSRTFGKWVGKVVSAAEWNQIFVPKGFAHGFVTLETGTEVQYKVSAPYAPELDRGIRFDDPEVGIDWPSMAEGYQLSAKDSSAPLIADAELFE